MDFPDLESTQVYLELLSHRNCDVAVSFVCTELLTGLSSCMFIRGVETIPETKKAWHLASANAALQHAEAAMWRLKMSHPEFDQMMALAERLRFEVESLQSG
jgi:hypothetical protein